MAIETVERKFWYGGIYSDAKQKKTFFLIKNVFFFKPSSKKILFFNDFFIIIYNLKQENVF